MLCLPRPSLLRRALAVLPAAAALLAALPALAVDTTPPRLPADAPASLAAPAGQAPAARRAAAPQGATGNTGPTGDRREPRIETRVIEDDGARIEERRVRGAVQSMTVTPKSGAPAYEVAPTDAGRHFGESPSVGRAGGQRTWRVLNF